MKIKLEDYRDIKRPITPIVPMNLNSGEASRRLILHAASRVINEHREALERLADKCLMLILFALFIGLSNVFIIKIFLMLLN